MNVESLTKPAEADSKTINPAYEDYVGKGGILDPKSFQMLETFSALDGNRIEASALRNSKLLISDMASHARVKLNQREVDMFILLSTLPENSTPVECGKKPQQLSDQALLAEILRVTDPVKRDKFVTKYPSISPPVGK